MRVLFAGDKPAHEFSVGRALTRSWISVERAAAASQALDLLRRPNLDIAILGQLGADQGGCGLLRRIRAAGIALPVLVLAPAAAHELRVAALDAGADDVLNEAFHPEELLARLRAILRRSKGHASSVLRAGPLELGLHTRSVTVSGEALRVTPKEFAVLELLLLNKGTALRKEAFLSHLYAGSEEPEIKIIDVLVCRLRKKLAEVGLASLIGTVWGSGYILRDDAAPAADRRAAA